MTFRPETKSVIKEYNGFSKNHSYAMGLLVTKDFFVTP